MDKAKIRAILVEYALGYEAEYGVGRSLETIIELDKEDI